MKVFEFPTQIMLVLGDDYFKNYWICKHVFFKALGSNWLIKYFGKTASHFF